MEKTRNISIAEYFEVLQREYIISEWRGKVYYSPRDKRYYTKVCGCKRERIDDIAKRNGLKSIFTDDTLMCKVRIELFNDNGKPRFNMTFADVQNYYSIGSEWSYDGEAYKLIAVNGFEMRLQNINSKDKMIVLDQRNNPKIRRIL